ncbi:peptidoglycan-binding domain-containing protein [Streptomyces sp. NPDC047869]|uniref:peptidoglycan-binding domain-containing protein n=1 Tax=Streptomyces sp. NPDC047869 TaxID=3154709 RepID=UPI0034512989
MEGWRSGEAHAPDDLPDDVAQWLADHPSRPERTAADQPFAHQGVIAEGVKNIQQRPNEPGWTPPLGVDGDFGPRTKEAVPWFQSGSGLTADGIVGNKTWRQLVGAQ